jgi:hypothetical protein
MLKKLNAGGALKRLAHAALGLVLTSALALAAFNLGFDGHIIPNSTSTPVLTSCGTSPTITGTDVAGTVTMGTATPTGCIITFAVAYALAPHCLVTWIATPLASQSYSTSATAITTTQTGTNSNVLKYACFAQPGG